MMTGELTRQPATAAPPLPGSVALRVGFDADRMAAEVLALRTHGWAAQRPYGSAGLSGGAEIDWRVLPLRSIGGDPGRTDPGGPELLDFADTPFLAHCQYLAEVLAAVPAPLRSVRLMALGPGVEVHEHVDSRYGLPYGGVRLHVPVITNPGAVVVIDRVEHHWTAGRLWFGDFGRPHFVRNTGTEPRIHLVIDAMVTAELLDLFPAEFLDRLPASEMVLTRPAVPLRPFELDWFRCRFQAPAAFIDWSDDAPGEQPDRPAEVAVMDGELVLLVEGRPTFCLVHVGTGQFRLRGWTDERWLHVDRDRVRLTVRTGRGVRDWTRPSEARPDDHG